MKEIKNFKCPVLQWNIRKIEKMTGFYLYSFVLFCICKGCYDARNKKSIWFVNKSLTGPDFFVKLPLYSTAKHEYFGHVKLVKYRPDMLTFNIETIQGTMHESGLEFLSEFVL